MTMVPLAERIRPKTVSEFFGQSHIMGKGKVLSRIIESGNIPNMIFYGPPGTGKTTLANIIAEKSGKRFYKLNATNASIRDIKDIIEDTKTLLGTNGVLLYLDEIQNFDKKRQQSLLEFIENGSITLIASTADNPYFCIYKAILSRCLVFEFKLLEKDDIISGLKRAAAFLKKRKTGFFMR
jgi:putative ATPase